MENTAWKIELCDECPSTNARIKERKGCGELADRTALMTYFQTSGRGQGKNIWHSTNGENLLCSFYRKVDIPIRDHFMLNIATSLALLEMLSELQIEAKIKWPNDIYVGNYKIAGILIENTLMRNVIRETIIGVGLNVNETNFPSELPNPCSIKGLNGKVNDLNEILATLIKELDKYFELAESTPEQLFHTYQKHLYRLNSWHSFRLDGKVLKGRIQGTERDGRLIVEFDNSQLQHFLFGEIQYMV